MHTAKYRNQRRIEKSSVYGSSELTTHRNLDG